MTSNINEIIAPVIGYFRNAVFSGASKPPVNNGAVLSQGNRRHITLPGKQAGITEESSTVSRDEVEKAIVKAHELVQSFSRKLSFSYDERIDRIIVRVMEGNGEKVVRQIPPEEMIRLSLKMDEIMGILINQDV